MIGPLGRCIISNIHPSNLWILVPVVIKSVWNKRNTLFIEWDNLHCPCPRVRNKICRQSKADSDRQSTQHSPTKLIKSHTSIYFTYAQLVPETFYSKTWRNVIYKWMDFFLVSNMLRWQMFFFPVWQHCRAGQCWL